MTNPFTAFAFDATGSNQFARTMPARVADTKNVRDFGAVGDGVTDDWAAIMAAVNYATAIDLQPGVTYFPPGTYLVSQPIDFSSASGLAPVFIGEMGASTITGNFADYIFTQTGSDAQVVVLDKLTIVNTNASGGGIRLGTTIGGAIRDCTVTANRGISDYHTDGPSPYFGSFEISIENCTLSPGSNVSGSIGMMKQSDGPVTNCRFIGFATGFLTAGEEGAQVLTGCYFQQCGNGVLLGQGPDGNNFIDSAVVISGCWFKNCSIAINVQGSSGLAKFVGLRIEGADGQAPGGLNCQYGIQDGIFPVPTAIGQSLIAGVTITGQFDVAGVAILGGGGRTDTAYIGVHCDNSSATPGALAWSVGYLLSTGTPFLPQFIVCSGNGMPFIYNVANLAVNQGVGDCFNVNDGTNSLLWGATLTNTGTHATHYKTRYNGSNFTVVGQ